MKILYINTNGTLKEIARADKFVQTAKDISGSDGIVLRGISNMSLF